MGASVSTAIALMVMYFVRVVFLKKEINMKINWGVNIMVYIMICIQIIFEHTINHGYLFQIPIVLLIIFINRTYVFSVLNAIVNVIMGRLHLINSRK